MPSNTEFAFVAPGAEGYQKDHPAAEHQTVIDADAGLASLSRKKIAICGFASSSRGRIPFDDPAWSLWGLNQLYRHIPRADRWFDIHLGWREGNVEGTDHPAWIKQCGIPVFMADLGALAPEPREAYPTVCRFPIERLIAKHGVDYFTSTVAIMLAAAIDEIDRAVEARAKEAPSNGLASAFDVAQLVRSLYAEYTIGIFGIDLIVGTEYDWQKACAEYWIGEASARGITVYIPPECALCKQQYRYGYQMEPATGIVGLSELKQRHAQLGQQRDQTLTKVYALQGAVEMLRKLIASPPVDLAKVLAEHETQLNQATALAQTLDGAVQENGHTTSVMELRLRGGQVPLLATAA